MGAQKSQIFSAPIKYVLVEKAPLFWRPDQLFDYSLTDGTAIYIINHSKPKIAKIERKIMIIVIVLTAKEVPLRYYYYCGITLQYYYDTIVGNIFDYSNEDIVIVK